LATCTHVLYLCPLAREQNEQSEEDDDSSEEESDSDLDDDRASLRRSVSSSRRSSARGSALLGAVPASGGVQIPGLTARQVKKLLELSAKAEAMTSNTSIEQLQQQIQQLMAQRDAEVAEKTRNGNAASLKRNGSSLSNVKINEIKELQKKLSELERKTQTIEITTRNTMSGGGGSSTIRATKAAVYMPLLVKDDDVFRKYFKLKDMSMPLEQIRAKMQADGVDPALLDTPDEISPNDPGVRRCASLGFLGLEGLMSVRFDTVGSRRRIYSDAGQGRPKIQEVLQAQADGHADRPD
jgi:hypothetical protein